MCNFAVIIQFIGFTLLEEENVPPPVASSFFEYPVQFCYQLILAVQVPVLA
jgi:hypothetical protein